ncbi:hypothetical protein [Flindersiella endophytica]
MADVLERPQLNLRTLLADSGEPRTLTTPREDLITLLVCTWTAIGVFVDANAHSNLTVPETFFTPWHAVLYSGYAATATWIAWLVYRNLRAGRRGRAAVPAGYLAAVVAVPLFALGGIGDLFWHTFIGIETTINVLFSPSHLALVVSIVVLMTTPLLRARAATADPVGRRFIPILVGLGLGTGIALMFTGYGTALRGDAAAIVDAISVKGGPVSMASVLAARLFITNFALLIPVLLLVQRWRPPFGSVTLLYVPPLLFGGVVAGFRNLTTLLSVLAAGLVVDLLIRWLRPSPDARVRFCTFAGLASLAIWTLYIGVAMVLEGRVPIPELFTGMPVVQGIFGVLLAALLVAYAPRRKAVDDQSKAELS